MADCDALIAKAEERNLKLGVVSQLRFSPGIQQVKQAMDARILGKLICADLYMKFHRSQDYYDSSDWRGIWEMDGGGAALENQGAAEVRSSSDPTQISTSGHARQIGNFNAAILGAEKLLIDGVEGRKAVQIILGAYQSSRENRPVSL